MRLKSGTPSRIAVALSLVCGACGGESSGGQGFGGAGFGGAGGGSGTLSLLDKPSVQKMDILFMIDNSISMGDKQEVLQEAVPVLLDRLINPVCVNPDGEPQTPTPPVGTECSEGYRREFKAIRDIHIGVITSSLGTYGAGMCNDANTNEKAHLIASLRDCVDPLGQTIPKCNTYQGLGFLAWDPDQKLEPPGEASAASLAENFKAMVSLPGERGCGFESSLEAWYRFLIEPEPVTYRKGDTDGVVDDALLQQRAAFLRPDSLVAIIMLTDENDCSMNPTAQGYLTADMNVPKGTTACDTNPNDPCCRACLTREDTPPEGCTPLADDPACASNGLLPAAEDNPNLRCWNQKQRFGVDFLYPPSRYVEGLTSHKIKNYKGEDVANPLFANADGGVSRDTDLVFLAGIVGVPWQDIATEESLTNATKLDYLTPEELNDKGVWDLILGDPAASPPVPPSDPLMLESPTPRTGANPVTGAALAGVDATLMANPINGHEWDTQGGDLQYACIFPLVTPKDCLNLPPGAGCDCGDSGITAKSPLCQQADNTYSNLQRYAKGYPGTRILRTLKEFGGNAILASICPKISDGTQAAYGYNPALNALVNRLPPVFSDGRCLPSPLPVDEAGQLQCSIVESFSPSEAGGICPDCSTVGGRSTAGAALVGAVRQNLQERGMCGQPGQEACEALCMCTIEQTEGSESADCRQQVDDSYFIQNDIAGFCYVDPGAGLGNAEIAAQCPPTQPRKLRFVGQDTPRNNSTTLISCRGSGPTG